VHKIRLRYIKTIFFSLFSLEDSFPDRILEGVEEGAECWEQGRRTAAVVASVAAAVGGTVVVSSGSTVPPSTYSPKMARSSPRGSVPSHLKSQVKINPFIVSRSYKKIISSVPLVG
jgi:hypothetical protein